MQNASLPKGTRDFTPEVMNKRKFIIDTIVSVYEKYGFQAIETPVMEHLSTLTGKYGDEGDKLLYKVLDSGDFLSKVDLNDSQNHNASALLPQIASKGLRYDLTIPFARYVVQHRNEITFPFRRYQVQPVWRADRPQKGRYREFWQCDADVIGTNSLVSELDLIQIYHEVMTLLGLKSYILKLNHRKLLEAIALSCGMNENFRALTVAIDKIDKIGWDGVSKELADHFESTSIAELQKFLSQSALNSETIERLNEQLADSPEKNQALKDLTFIVEGLQAIKSTVNPELDLSLARGLDYYTGCIFEAIIPDGGVGSVSGGGRYDDLTGVFGLKDVSGVGVSFGIDRLYDVLQSLNLFPELAFNQVSILFCHFDEDTRMACLEFANRLRLAGISAEVYPDVKKIKKQMDYANRTGIPYVAIIGGDELKNNSVQLKNLSTGDQRELKISELIETLE